MNFGKKLSFGKNRVLEKTEFWEIDELLLEPCCALKYYPEIEVKTHTGPLTWVEKHRAPNMDRKTQGP